MKTTFMTLLLSLVFSGTVILAHPPAKPQISYDKVSGNLTITFSHPVKDVSKHYLDKITILIDGEEYEILEFQEQTNLKEHVIKMEIPNLEKGTKIKVIAQCNIFGKKKSKFVVK